MRLYNNCVTSANDQPFDSFVVVDENAQDFDDDNAVGKRVLGVTATAHTNEPCNGGG